MSKRLTTEEFIERARKVHGDKYDYSKVEYVNTDTKVCIICPIHGEFWQTPHVHLKGGECQKCSKITSCKKIAYSLSKFIKKAKKLHGNKYDYSKVEFIDLYTKVCVICPIHGEFWIIPRNHLNVTNPSGCIKCGRAKVANEQMLGNETFIENSKKIHGDKYDYSKVEYVNSHTKVKIICPIHGEFEQRPNNHLQGQGCPICKQSRMENEIELFLLSNNIIYEKQKTFDLLLNKRNLKIDFYLPQYNIAIECQGRQHFEAIHWIKNEEKRQKQFELTKQRDLKKFNYCNENGINIIYFLRREYNHNALNLDIGIYNEKNIINNSIIK